MKMIVCDGCHDVVALQADQKRHCKCHLSSGQYVDNHVIEVDGPCRIIGIDNALRYGTATRTESWEIREPHPNIRRPRAKDGPMAALGGLL